MTQEEYQPVLVVAVNQLSLLGAEVFLLFVDWGAAIVEKDDCLMIEKKLIQMAKDTDIYISLMAVRRWENPIGNFLLSARNVRLNYPFQSRQCSPELGPPLSKCTCVRRKVSNAGRCIMWVESSTNGINASIWNKWHHWLSQMRYEATPSCFSVMKTCMLPWGSHTSSHMQVGRIPRTHFLGIVSFLQILVHVQDKSRLKLELTRHILERVELILIIYLDHCYESQPWDEVWKATVFIWVWTDKVVYFRKQT